MKQPFKFASLLTSETNEGGSYKEIVIRASAASPEEALEIIKKVDEKTKDLQVTGQVSLEIKIFQPVKLINIEHRDIDSNQNGKSFIKELRANFLKHGGAY